MSAYKKIIYGALAITGISSISIGAYYLFKHYFNKPIPLSTFLEEYFLEAETRLQNEPTLTEETVCFIINLYIELEEYLFNYDNKELEKERIILLSKELKKEYERALLITIALHDDYLIKAKQIIEHKLNISLDTIQKQYSEINTKDITIMMKQNRKKFTLLCQTSEDYKGLTKETIKKAYLEWTQLNIERDETASQLYLLSIKNENYANISTQSFIFNKYYVKDKIKMQYNIYPKHFPELLSIYELENDEEIIKASQSLENLLFG